MIINRGEGVDTEERRLGGGVQRENEMSEGRQFPLTGECDGMGVLCVVQDNFFRDCKNGVMQRRGNGMVRSRMFGGSSDQQFNIIQRSRSNARDFRSMYATDFVS
jgi:hypothetical protein